MQAPADEGGLGAEAGLRIGLHIRGRNEANVGAMDERALAIAHRRHGIAELAPVRRAAEVELGLARLGRVNDAAVEAVAVVAAVERGEVVGEDAALQQQCAGRIFGRNARAADEVEGVGKGRTLDEAGIVAARQFFQPLEAIVLADGELQGSVIVGHERVEQYDVAFGEIGLDLISEAAGDRSAETHADAAQFVRKAERGIGDRAGCADIGGIDLNPAARLEAPAVGGLDLGRALPFDLRRRGLGGGRRSGSRRRDGRRRRLIEARFQGFDLGPKRREFGAQRGRLLGAHRLCMRRRRQAEHRRRQKGGDQGVAHERSSIAKR